MRASTQATGGGEMSKFIYSVAGRKFKSKKEAHLFADANDFKIVWREEDTKWVSKNGLVHVALKDLTAPTSKTTRGNNG